VLLLCLAANWMSSTQSTAGPARAAFGSIGTQNSSSAPALILPPEHTEQQAEPISSEPKATERHSEPTEPAAAAEPTNTNPEHTESESEPQSEPKAPTLAEIAADYTAGTADSIRRRWQSFKAKAARVALAVAPWLGVGLILGLTLAVFVIAILNVPAWVERLPILPRAFVGCLFIFLPTLGAEMLIIKVFAAIDAKTGFFGFNPLACR
jgi:cytoskeletal protein RodZ